MKKEGSSPSLKHAAHHIDMRNRIEGMLPDLVIVMMQISYTNHAQ